MTEPSSKSEVCDNTGVPEGMCPCPECLASIEPQSPPVAQVEVYRRALEMISQHEDCLCKPGMEVGKEALLTSKPEPVATLAHKFIKIRQDSRGLDYRECSVCGMPEGLSELCLPVAPVRKWKAEDVVGYFSFTKDGFRHQVLYETLSPEVQDALNGRKL